MNRTSRQQMNIKDENLNHDSIRHLNLTLRSDDYNLKLN